MCPRVFQVNISTDNGASWKGVSSLSPAGGHVDYPIVAAAKTSAGPVNLYGAWVDSETGKVKFRQKTGGGSWSSPIVIGSTSATLDASYGKYGYTNIAAVRDLILVAWIADDTGTLKTRAINLKGNAAAAKTVANWKSIVTLSSKISLNQNGFPIASASPLNPNLVTVAWNTATQQRYTTFNGTTTDPAGKLIWANGTLSGRTYVGGYSTVAEPGPGGSIVASWGACKDTSSDCNYNKNTSRFDLLVSTSSNGTNFTTPVVVANSDKAGQTLNDEPSIVAINNKIYLMYNGYLASYTSYDVYTKVGTGSY